MTLLIPMFCKASLPFKLLLLEYCSSQLIKCSSMSLEPSNPLPFGLLKALVPGTRLNSNSICKRIRQLPTSCVGHVGTQSRTELELLMPSLEHHFPHYRSSEVFWLIQFPQASVTPLSLEPKACQILPWEARVGQGTVEPPVRYSQDTWFLTFHLTIQWPTVHKLGNLSQTPSPHHSLKQGHS